MTCCGLLLFSCWETIERRGVTTSTNVWAWAAVTFRCCSCLFVASPANYTVLCAVVVVLLTVVVSLTGYVRLISYFLLISFLFLVVAEMWSVLLWMPFILPLNIYNMCIHIYIYILLTDWTNQRIIWIWMPSCGWKISCRAGPRFCFLFVILKTL